jgi:hypothetical protein
MPGRQGVVVSAPRRILIEGPFSHDELLDIIELLRRIEARRPAETFSVFIDDEDTERAAQEFMDRVPLTPGYERITRFAALDKE